MKLNDTLKLFEILNNDTFTCTRFGGDEFVVLLPHTDLNEAKNIAERLRRSIENAFKEEAGITTSIGVSNCPTDSKDLKKIIKKADEALYISKGMGKNRVNSF